MAVADSPALVGQAAQNRHNAYSPSIFAIFQRPGLLPRSTLLLQAEGHPQATFLKEVFGAEAIAIAPFRPPSVLQRGR
ncbi:MAG: hypothetical protein ACFB12_16320 [Leptolyngbyaceae cyanobacterium]